MKILLHCHVPFLLAHGGAQIQIEQTKLALEKIGVEVEYLRWFDGNQTGDVLHFFGRIPGVLVELAHQKRMKVVLADLLTAQGSRSNGRLRVQSSIMRVVESVAPGLGANAFNWKSYRDVDACVALTAWEAKLMGDLFGAPPNRLHVIPNGVEEVFLNAKPRERGKWLVCTATITERKRVLELAEAAVKAETPLWIVGRAYSENDSYAKRFFDLTKQHSDVIRFEGAISDRTRMAEVYREARGFVLLSTMESLSLSALEAAACECPLLLSDLPWARTVFGDRVSYCPITPDVGQTAKALRAFYDAAPTLKAPHKPLTWVEVAQQFRALYESLLKTSR